MRKDQKTSPNHLDGIGKVRVMVPEQYAAEARSMLAEEQTAEQ